MRLFYEFHASVFNSYMLWHDGNIWTPSILHLAKSLLSIRGRLAPFSSSIIILCKMMQAFIMELRSLCFHSLAAWRIIFHRACNTPNARSTSFLQLSYRSTKNLSLLLMGEGMVFTKVAQSGHIPSAR
jgi:hypothetical protein